MKKTLMVLIVILLFAGICSADETVDISLYNYAAFLDRLAIFNGNENGYELSKNVTRSEAVAMLVRLLGKETEALNTDGVTPFDDKGWADKYILYSYNNNLTKGIGNTVFGINEAVTRNQFCTFVLRALGYSEGNGDFTYEAATEFAKQLLNVSLTDSEFTRGEMAKLCYYALFCKINKTDRLLSDIAVADKAALEAATAEMNRNTKKCSSVNVMIYMVGSDLESLLGRGTDDIEEILNTKIGKNVNTYILTGGTSNWKNDYITDGKTQLFKASDKKLSLIENLDNMKVSDSGTLTQFIKKCNSMSACDRNILILWNHGEGTLGGFGRDELNENKTMSILDLKQGIQNSGVYFDIIGFDACLMGTVETAYAMDGLCTYLIASEELEPSCGWYYTTWLNTLETNPSVDLLVLSKLMVDSSIVHSSIDTFANSVMAVINVSKAKELQNRLYEAMLAVDYSSIENIDSLGAREGGYDQFDITWIFNKDNFALYNSVNKTVVYNRLSAPFMESCGLAFYSPKQHLDKYEEVKTMLISLGYNREYFNAIEK